MSFYTDAQRALQARFGTGALADRIEQAVVTETLSADQIAFIERQPLFFLSTVNGEGQPSVSYKGGAPGFVRALNERTLVFPNYDGNGMFYSMGNIESHAQIGILFVDFQTPNRLRVQARAELVIEGPLLVSYPGANLVVQASVQQAWVNCPRYVHRLTLEAPSPYVPDAQGDAPVALWKRIEGMGPLLSEADRIAVADAGEISAQEYARKLAAGELV